MIVSAAWAGQRYAVLGLARSGMATVRALAKAGAYVVAWDSDPAARKAAAEVNGVIVHDIATLNLEGAAGLVVSPGVPLNTHPLVVRARAAGVPVIGDIELFAQARAELPPHKVVGITGTNGKSTTTALVHHILKTAGVPTLMGGNIGLPILGQEPLPEGGVYVLELSSYQIDLTQTLDCDVAVLLNITPDHLDRYDGFGAYAASKQRLFEIQSRDHHAVIAEDDTEADNVVYRLQHDLNRYENVHYFHRGNIKDQSAWPALQGPHNASNAAAAITACAHLGVDNEAVAEGLRTFTGLPHRMERVATRDGVTFVDDSKATNPESTAPALGAFERVHWIVGGKRKGDDLDACAPYFDRVVAAYTIGEAGPLFRDLLAPRVPAVTHSGDLATAVAQAAAAAQPGETVLLSPACASFDQFRDYEDRGAAFRAAVEAL
ncbi:UDP-N-acetylmuramoyl-L-alanine--D-glutamate ligase [Sphingomonas sp. RP10(2022)]|uniref:UDP-N-acetylmuramoylalanine--D-glutamate ligase n=1 Tax=Sphingomonas liriopis TaxID=2949094 RepID=A0A9X2HWS8_9SPHN|nr:UDP-N-acetylmuramoyl-L-alanine--D-glutamate ligase [Sphingomonas liriopis]MCP3734854.1 UDP-N-acetylmuramoyl-L-alanine--D-glutamate ligase [Sphingomonas liriopis]